MKSLPSTHFWATKLRKVWYSSDIAFQVLLLDSFLAMFASHPFGWIPYLLWITKCQREVLSKGNIEKHFANRALFSFSTLLIPKPPLVLCLATLSGGNFEKMRSIAIFITFPQKVSYHLLNSFHNSGGNFEKRKKIIRMADVMVWIRVSLPPLERSAFFITQVSFQIFHSLGPRNYP